jgi:D-sedoheptulose 7-phosphate isomerase
MAVAEYFSELGRLGGSVIVTTGTGRESDAGEFVEWVIARSRAAHSAGRKLIFIGNGGSASIASHMAQDYSKTGGMRALALNDSSFLTCVGNDLGYEHVFAKQIELHAFDGDLLIAISSSGKSPNIINAVAAARARDCQIVTLSGFGADNPLRRLGAYNLYVPSASYGFVEIAHLAVCHCILDTAMGWQPSRSVGQ